MSVPYVYPSIARRQRGPLALLLVAGLGWTSSLLAQPEEAPPQPAAKEFYQDFRGSRPLHPALKLIGPDIDEAVKAEDQGLRITLPKDRARNYPVEVMTLFSLVGDFEITGSYELLSADQPAKGYGVGVFLNLATNDSRDTFAGLARAMRVKDGSVYLAEYWRKDPHDYKTFSMKTEARAGQLRLARVGSTVRFLVADGPGNDFREIKQREFGTDDLAHVRFSVCDSGTPGNAVDVRLVDLKIRAGKFSPDPVAAGGPAADGPEKSADRGWLMAALLIGAAVVVFIALAVGAALFFRRRPAAPTPANNETTAASVAVACAGCGKKLKAKAEWAGKNVKCPQCGKPTPMPPSAALPSSAPARRFRTWLIVLAAFMTSGVLAALLVARLLASRHRDEPYVSRLQILANRVRARTTDTIDARPYRGVTDLDLTVLEGLPHLKNLNLDNTETTDAGLKTVAGATQLVTLSLTNTQVTDAGLAELRTLTALEELRLDKLPITDAGLTHLSGLTRLKKLSLYKTGVTDNGLEVVKRLPALERLSLDDTQVGDTGLRHLHACSNLKRVSVWRTQVSAAGVQKLRDALPRLEVNR